MTKQNNIYFDGGEIIKTRASYKIMFEEENCTVFISSTAVEELQSLCNEDEYLIAVLLGYIDYVRKSTNTTADYFPKIPQDKLVESVSKLLKSYTIEFLTNLFHGLKWHEILQILNSSNPLLEIKAFV